MGVSRPKLLTRTHDSPFGWVPGLMQNVFDVGYTLAVGIGATFGHGAAQAIGWGMARYTFDFDCTASAWVPLIGAIAGAVLAWAAGWWGLREVLQRPVVETLRRAAE